MKSSASGNGDISPYTASLKAELRNCELQNLAVKFNVTDVKFEGEKNQHMIDNISPSIVRDFNKCILCRRCVSVCKNVQKIGAICRVF